MSNDLNSYIVVTEKQDSKNKSLMEWNEGCVRDVKI